MFHIVDTNVVNIDVDLLLSATLTICSPAPMVVLSVRANYVGPHDWVVG
jgi:hypothetical protein